jgi:hypothetical protein
MLEILQQLRIHLLFEMKRSRISGEDPDYEKHEGQK